MPFAAIHAVKFVGERICGLCPKNGCGMRSMPATVAAAASRRDYELPISDCSLFSERVRRTRTAPSDFPSRSAMSFVGEAVDVPQAECFPALVGERRQDFLQLKFFLVARKGLAGGSDAGDQQVDERSVLRVVAGGVQPHLAAGCSLLRAEKFAVNVDQPVLGDLAQPTERVAIGVGQLSRAAEGFQRHLLQDIIGFDLLAQRRPEVLADIRQQLRTVTPDELTHRRGVCRAGRVIGWEGVKIPWGERILIEGQNSFNNKYAFSISPEPPQWMGNLFRRQH